MLKMEPVTLTTITVLAALGVGFGAGWGLKPDAGVHEQGQQVAVEEATRESAIANKLTDLPPPCIKEVGGDPMSLQCMWALCIRTGETDKQRCEPSKLTDKLLGSYSCPDLQ